MRPSLPVSQTSGLNASWCGQYVRIVALEFAVACAVLALMASLSPARTQGALAAGAAVILMTVLAVISAVLFDWSREKQQALFGLAMLGGFFAKLTVIGLAVVVVLSYTTWPIGAFIAGLFVAWVMVSMPLLALLLGLKTKQPKTTTNAETDETEGSNEEPQIG